MDRYWKSGALIKSPSRSTPPSPPIRRRIRIAWWVVVFVAVFLPARSSGAQVYLSYFYTPADVTVFMPEVGTAVSLKTSLEAPVWSNSATLSSGEVADVTGLGPGFYRVTSNKKVVVMAGDVVTGSGSHTRSYYARDVDGKAVGTELYTYLRSTTENNSPKLFVFSHQDSNNVTVRYRGEFGWETVWSGTLGNGHRQDIARYSPDHIQITSDYPVSALVAGSDHYDDPGAHCIPAISSGTFYGDLFSTWLPGGETYVYSYTDDTTVELYDTFTINPTPRISWNLDKGEVGSYPIPFDQPFAITVQSTNPISMCRMFQNVATTNGMHYVPAKSGTMIGTEFVIDANDPIEVIAYEDGTAVEYTQRNGTVHSYTLGALSHRLLPSATAGRLTATKAVSVVATSTIGATFVPIPVTALDTAPGPPAVFAVRHNPPDPTVNDGTVTVTWATDEPATTCMSYRRNGGAWIISPCSQTYHNQHSVQIDISTYAADDLVEYYVWAVDKDNNTVLNDNNGQNYSFTITDDIPQLSVSRLSSLPPSTNNDPFTINLMVENTGISEAQSIQIRERVTGMISPTTATALIPITTREFTLEIPVPNIPAGGFTVVSYDLIPLLYPTYSTFGVNISTPSVVSYRSTGGQTFSSNFSIPVNFSASAALSWIRGKDYTMPTNIGRLRSLNTAAQAGLVLEEAARLALARDGVVAELETTDVYAIEKLVNSSWNGRLGYIGFGGWRFLMFIGCQGVVPTFSVEHKCTALKTRYATTADNIYADVNTGDYYKPEVIVARLPGENANRLVSQLRNSLTTVSDDRAVLMSGTGNGLDMFVDAIDSADTMLSWYTTHVKRHWKDLPDKATRLSTFLSDAPNSDLIVYRGHGGVGSWDATVANADARSANFGSKHPMVWSIACETGRVTEDSLAEAFLDSGASLYIGASQLSARSQNNDLLYYLSKYHTMTAFYPTIGDAFKWAKRRVVEDNISWASTCYADYRTKQLINQYNLFGDPKRGQAFQSKTAVPKLESAKSAEGPPPDHIELTLPDYVVTSTETGIDYVSFPGEEGGTFEAEGQPVVPVYIHRVAFGPEFKVRDVSQGERGGLESSSGLNLPTASFADDDGAPVQPPPPTKLSTSFPAPDTQYAWRVEEQLDGTHELLLTVYPFFYDSTTSEVEFYRNHAFNVSWNTSATAITSIEPSQEVFALGDPIDGVVEVHQGSGGTIVADFEVDLLDESSGDVVASMDPHVVGLDEGPAALDFGIAFEATEPASYLVRARLTATGDLLDEATKRVRVGRVSAVGEALWVDPHPSEGFEIGELITVNAWFENTGPNTVGGRTRIQVIGTSTAEVVHQRTEVVDIEPGATRQAETVWNTSTATDGTYRVSAVLEYEGLSTDPMTEDLFTLRDMEIALATDREVYDVGDKVVVWASCTDADGEPLVVTPTLWLALPDASSVPIQLTYLSNLGIYSGWHFLAAGSPTGPYGFALTADAAGYHSASAQHFFSVGGAPPTPGFTWSPLDPTVSEQIQFTDSSVGSPISWAWSFGDGTTSSSQNPVHTYGTSGDLEVTLGVTNVFGTTWITQTVTVTATAEPVFSDGFESGDCSRWSVEVP
jgi:hypothetical protein